MERWGESAAKELVCIYVRLCLSHVCGDSTTQGVPSRSKTCFWCVLILHFLGGERRRRRRRRHTMGDGGPRRSKEHTSRTQGPRVQGSSFLFVCVFVVVFFANVGLQFFFALSTVSHIFEYVHTWRIHTIRLPILFTKAP